jgi:hypothetical protein
MKELIILAIIGLLCYWGYDAYQEKKQQRQAQAAAQREFENALQGAVINGINGAFSAQPAPIHREIYGSGRVDPMSRPLPQQKKAFTKNPDGTTSVTTWYE